MGKRVGPAEFFREAVRRLRKWRARHDPLYFAVLHPERGRQLVVRMSRGARATYLRLVEAGPGERVTLSGLRVVGDRKLKGRTIRWEYAG